MPKKPQGPIEVGDVVRVRGKQDRLAVRELKPSDKYGEVATCVDIARKQFQFHAIGDLELLKKAGSPAPIRVASKRTAIRRKKGR